VFCQALDAANALLAVAGNLESSNDFWDSEDIGDSGDAVVEQGPSDGLEQRKNFCDNLTIRFRSHIEVEQIPHQLESQLELEWNRICEVCFFAACRESAPSLPVDDPALRV
jgi:hypothetical protein